MQDDDIVPAFFLSSLFATPASLAGYAICHDLSKTYPRMRYAGVPFLGIGMTYLSAWALVPAVIVAAGFKRNN